MSSFSKRKKVEEMACKAGCIRGRAEGIFSWSLEVPGVGESLSTDQTTTRLEETQILKATTRSQDFQASASRWSNSWTK